MTTSSFLKSPSEYTRDIDIVKNAQLVAAQYLQIQTGKPYDKCLEFIKSKETKPIDLMLLHRQENGDRVQVKLPIDTFLSNAFNNESIITPNMVEYLSPKVKLSCTAQYIDGQMKKRDEIKGLEKEAELRGDAFEAEFQNCSQTACKNKANSSSGAKCTPHNVLYAKSAHSSLTSICRVATSYSNANTERMLSGNRHYFSLDIVIENISSITLNTDYVRLEGIVKKYNLVSPSVDDVMTLVKRCIKFYWVNQSDFNEIRILVENLTSLQRIAFCYTGDLYWLARCNEEVVRNMLTEFITRPEWIVDNPDDVMAIADGDIIALASVLCSDILDGNSVKNLKKITPDGFKVFASTVLHVNNTLSKYSDLLITFLATDNLPASVFYFPNSIRRSVIGSDTDSTMFTIQNWAKWYTGGKVVINDDTVRLGETLCYLCSQALAHILATVSKQMGVEDKWLFRLKMKNEFGFRVYMRANRAKHYASAILSREGNVFKDPIFQIKGVGLKDSKVAPLVMKGLQKEVNNIMVGIMNNNGVNIIPIIRRIANIEHLITKSLAAGETTYLSSVNIQIKNAYKKPMSTNYLHHDLWEMVYEQTYGEVDNPPYSAYKLCVTTVKSKQLDAWIETMNEDIKYRFKAWIGAKNRDKFTSMLLPKEIFMGGIPPEFISIIDTRKIVSLLTAAHYIMLEMCGIFIKNKKISVLASDDYSYDESYGIPGDELYLTKFNRNG